MPTYTTDILIVGGSLAGLAAAITAKEANPELTVTVVDVLTDGGRISGAVGYHIDSGEHWLFQAKAVVLATGSQNYRVMPMWSPGRGSGLAFALYSGRMAGVSAANYAAGHSMGQLSQEQIAAADRRFRAPLAACGAVDGYALLDEIHKVMQPLGNSLYRRQDRIEGALARVRELKGQLPQVGADDPHSLFACNEYRSMLLCAELFFNGSLARQESSGWFLREDYPEHGARPEWYIQVADGDGIRVTAEAVPLDRYPNQPG